MADANDKADGRKKVYLKPSPDSIRDLETKPILSTEVKERKREEKQESSFDYRVRSNGFDPMRAYEKEWEEAAMEEEENEEGEEEKIEDNDEGEQEIEEEDKDNDEGNLVIGQEDEMIL